MIMVQAGNQDAYGALFARYRRPVWSWLARRTRNAELSAELYQETFLRVWKSANTYQKGQPVKPWVFRIAANVQKDRFRREQRRIDTVELDTVQAGEHVDPLSGRDLERAIAALPEHLRDAFLLSAIEGMDHHEVADILEISPANARQRVARARAQLRESLAAQGGG